VGVSRYYLEKSGDIHEQKTPIHFTCYSNTPDCDDRNCVARHPGRCAGGVHKEVGPGECRALAIATSLALDMSCERFTCFGSSSLTVNNHGGDLSLTETDTSNRRVFSYWFDHLRVPPAQSPWVFPVPND